MESFNLNIQLNEEQKKYREECITFCMNDSFVLNFLEENDDAILGKIVNYKRLSFKDSFFLQIRRKNVR